MANALYDIARRTMLAAGLDWVNANVKVALVDTAGATPYAFDPTHQYLYQIPSGAVRGVAALTGKTISANGAAAASDVVFSGVPIGPPIEAIVGYVDTGNASTSMLIFYMDDVAGLPVTPPGVPLTLVWDGGSTKVFRP